MQKSALGKCVLGLVAGVLAANAQAVPILYVSDTFGDNVHVINPYTNGEVVAPIPIAHEHPLAPVVSHDGRYAYVQSTDGAISVIDVSVFAVTRTFDNPNPDAPDGPASMTLSPDDTILYASAAGTGDIARIDTSTGAVVSRIAGHSAWGASPLIRASHDGQRLYVLAAAAGKIDAIDAGSGELVGTATVPLSGQFDELLGFALTPDDATIAAVTYYGNFLTIDTATMTIRSTRQVGTTLYGIDLSPDGSHAFIAESNDGCLIDFDMPDGEPTGTSWGPNGCFAVAAGLDGHRAFLANYDVATNTYTVAMHNNTDQSTRISAPFGYPNFDGQSVGPATTTPQAGAWWNPAEPGRSFNIEVRHDTLVLTAQVYDEQGAPTWLLASGPYDAAAGTYLGSFTRYTGGQCLGCAYRAPQDSPADNGSLQLIFTSETTGFLDLDGTRIPIEKFDW
jgi:DNA-binding beta-propeller fold protein YncE